MCVIFTEYFSCVLHFVFSHPSHPPSVLCHWWDYTDLWQVCTGDWTTSACSDASWCQHPTHTSPTDAFGSCGVSKKLQRDCHRSGIVTKGKKLSYCLCVGKEGQRNNQIGVGLTAGQRFFFFFFYLVNGKKTTRLKHLCCGLFICVCVCVCFFFFNHGWSSLTRGSNLNWFWFIHFYFISCSLIGSLVNTQSALKMSNALYVLRQTMCDAFGAWSRVNITSTDPYFLQGKFVNTLHV